MRNAVLSRLRNPAGNPASGKRNGGGEGGSGGGGGGGGRAGDGQRRRGEEKTRAGSLEKKKNGRVETGNRDTRPIRAIKRNSRVSE